MFACYDHGVVVAAAHVSADGAEWIDEVVAQRALMPVVCLDAFHVVA